MANTDTWAFFRLLLFFVSLGTLLPFIQVAFNQAQITQDIDGLPVSSGSLEDDPVEMLQIIISVFSVFFWTFGQVHFIIDLIILTPLRILALYLFVRMVRGI